MQLLKIRTKAYPSVVFLRPTIYEVLKFIFMHEALCDFTSLKTKHYYIVALLYNNVEWIVLLCSC